MISKVCIRLINNFVRRRSCWTTMRVCSPLKATKLLTVSITILVVIVWYLQSPPSSFSRIRRKKYVARYYSSNTTTIVHDPPIEKGNLDTLEETDQRKAVTDALYQVAIIYILKFYCHQDVIFDFCSTNTQYQLFIFPFNRISTKMSLKTTQRIDLRS